MIQELNKPSADNAGVILFPPLLFFIAILLGETVAYFFPLFRLQWPPTIGLGTLLLAAALVILRMAARQMIKNRTTIHPKGKTTTIVSGGIYSHTRNPMYLSFTLIFIATLVATNAWAGLILLIPLLFIVQKGIINREEYYLTEKFGNDYIAYKNKVRTWI